MAYQNDITHLKHLIVTENDFAVTANYFMDLVEKDEVHEQGKLFEKGQETYRQLMTEVIQERYGREVKLMDLMLQHIENCHFIHGICNLSNGKMLAMFFFTDIQMGMAMVSSFDIKTTDFFRLSFFISEGVPLPEKAIVPMQFSKTYN